MLCEAVFAWNPAAPKDHNGNASYEARVDYLLRNTGPEWARYAKADNEHIRQTLLALNKGTHAPSPPFTDLAQEITIVRSQYALLLILTVTQG